MEKIRGRYYGSCWECAHSYDVNGVDDPVVMCHPTNEMMAKYAEGCKYLIPKCEHNEIHLEDLKRETPTKRPKKEAEKV